MIPRDAILQSARFLLELFTDLELDPCSYIHITAVHPGGVCTATHQLRLILRQLGKCLYTSIPLHQTTNNH
jgi:hypothetical protein